MKNYTDITVIVDESGSMHHLIKDTIGGFNKFIEDQKAAPGEAKLSLITFNHGVRTHYTALNVQSVGELNEKNYMPGGSTCLFDTVGLAIDQAGKRFSDMPEHERPNRVLFVIITDGEDTSSRMYTPQRLKEMTQCQQNNYKWEFNYIGANQDSFTMADSMGLKGANTINYAATKGGTLEVYRSLSANVLKFRSTGDASFDASAKAANDAQIAAAKGQPLI